MNEVSVTRDNPQGEKAPPGAQTICIIMVDTSQIGTIQI